MKAYIIEDEMMAREQLARTLRENFPDVEVCGSAGSVAEAVAYLGTGTPDVIFMDVELSDGKCFEIFRQVPVRSQVVMTTAYDSYAVKAFEVNSVDYLLKPVSLQDLRRAVERCRQKKASVDVEALLGALAPRGDAFRERFLVHHGDHIVPLRSADVVCFFSGGKENYVLSEDGCAYMLDQTLDSVASELDPERFFRISRGCIVAKDSVRSVTRLLGGRLRVEGPARGCNPAPDLDVSRSRSEEFLSWLAR